jgi:RNA polymerase sigma-70 factor (ECF subfamily)
MRTAFNWQRSWWRRTRLESLGAAVPERASQTEEVDTRLRELVRRLPRRQRDVVALRLIADLSAEQTADILGISAATVHVHLHRALSTLRKQTEPLEVW